MLDPISLGIGGVTALTKLGLAGYQAGQAARLRFSDTTTPEQREMLQMARQRAASGRLPGSGLATARLAQGQNTTLQNAMLGSGSGTELLAASAAAGRTRQMGEVNLASQGAQFNERAQAGLTQQLGLQAQQRQRDLAAYNQQKAALSGAAIQNIGGAVDTGTAYAAYGANKTADAAASTDYTNRVTAEDELPYRQVGLPQSAPTMSAPGIRGVGLPGYTPGIYSPGMGLRSGYYGGGRTRSRYAGL